MLAGAEQGIAARLAGAMLGIQCSIGALNDLVDAPLDARQKPSKPIPRGLVSIRIAGAVAIVGAATGIALSSVSGPATAVAALGCLGLGYAYDLRLSRTAFSWLPLALALPLLPIHAWLGATGLVPGALVTLLPIGVLAGAGLALANGLVDIDRDALGGRRAAAVTLGRGRTWTIQTAVLGAAAGLVVALAPAVASEGEGMLATLRMLRDWGAWLGIAALAAGAITLLSRHPAIRERGWELEAGAIACLGISWLAGTAAT